MIRLAWGLIGFFVFLLVLGGIMTSQPKTYMDCSAGPCREIGTDINP